MSSLTRRSRRKLFFTITCLTCVTLLLLCAFYDEKNSWGPKIVNLDKITTIPRNHKVLLPAGFSFPAMVVENHLRGTFSENWPSIQLKQSEVLDSPPHESRSFQVSESVIFRASKHVDCRKKSHKIKFATDNSEHISLNLKKVFQIFLEEAISEGNTYNHHLFPVLEQYMANDKIDGHWFRMSGASVWLKDYNVHFVVSRLVMSEIGKRKNPRLSMILTQVYDEEWHEVEDVQMVFPTNSIDSDLNPLGFRLGGQDFMSYRFPRILSIPFDLGRTSQYWGAEDPRIILVKNKNGHDEPVVVFNAYHTKVQAKPLILNKHVQRSMFMSFPFQVQKGKPMDLLDRETTKDDWFTRTKRLTIKNQPERILEKNWSPSLPAGTEYHKHVMFVTQFDPLNIIKCDLWTSDGACEPQDTYTQSVVGHLRGGTPLISVRSVPAEDTEYFVGFARAHFKDCGCGDNFYRPNLVVLARVEKKWVLTHVSSFLDLGLEVTPYTPGQHVCASSNAIIPNGIESWDFKRDILVLALSVSDISVERVRFHGVLRALEKAKYWEGKNEDESASLVKCALTASNDFCMAYAIKQLVSTQGRESFE